MCTTLYYILLVILLEHQENHIIHIYGAKSVVHAYLHSLSNNIQGECIGSRSELKLLVGSVGRCPGLHNDRLLLFTRNPLAVSKIVQLKARKAKVLPLTYIPVVQSTALDDSEESEAGRGVRCEIALELWGECGPVG